MKYNFFFLIKLYHMQPIFMAGINSFYSICACSVTKLYLTLLWLHSPGSSDHRISQARILEWVAISYAKLQNSKHFKCHTIKRSDNIKILTMIPKIKLNNICEYLYTEKTNSIWEFLFHYVMNVPLIFIVWHGTDTPACYLQ